MNLNILITHVSYQAANSFIKMLRACKGYNIKIIGCSKIPKGFSSGSVLVDKFIHLPICNERNYIDSIQKICSDENISLILTAEEQDLILFKKYQIKQALYDFIPDPKIINLLQDKYTATNAMREIGIRVPQILTNFEEALVYNKLIRRKRISCSSRGISIFEKDKLPINEPLICSDYITQPFIEGDEYTVDIFCDKNGKPLMIMPRICLARKDGTTVKCIIKKSDTIINSCKLIYDNFKLPGVTNIQFIEKDGNVYFIELNPRAAANVISTLRATSINWLELYISHFFNNEKAHNYSYYQDKIYWNTTICRYYEETVYFGN